MLSSVFIHWRTSLFGAISAGFGAIAALTGAITWKQAIPAFITAAIGFLAHDGTPRAGQ